MSENSAEKVLEILRRGVDYFTWTELHGPRWILRVPVPGGPMAGEPEVIVHVCRPVSLMEAIEANQPEKTVAHSGYVAGPGTYTDEGKVIPEGTCIRCLEVRPRD